MKKVIFQKINLSKNKNSQIIGNQIGTIYNNYNSNIMPNIKVDLTLRESKKFDDLFENKRIENSPIFRHESENLKFEQIIKLSQLYNYSPVLRVYGCFTSLSSIRQKTETSDLAQLELLEKSNILKFIESNFETKIIISLDENMIFSNNRYNVEQYTERCKDLINTITAYKDYKNLKIVIDFGNNLDAMYIFDTILICYLPTMLFDSDKITYGQAIFDSEINSLISKIKTFDERFSLLEGLNNDVCKFMNFENKNTFFHYIVKYRKNKYFNNL